MRSRLLHIGIAVAAATAGAAAFAQLGEPAPASADRDVADPRHTPVGQAVTVRPTHGYPIRGTLVDFSVDWITLRDREGHTYWIPRDTVWYIESRTGKPADSEEPALDSGSSEVYQP